MKKILILALLSIVFRAMADDYYLYWMVGDNATVTSTDGKTTVDLTTYGTPLYAKIRMVDTTSGEAVESYLNFYTSPDSGTDYGQVEKFKPDFAIPTFAGVSSNLRSDNISYWVELYNSSTEFSDSSWIGQALLNWDSSMVATAGQMVEPPNYATVSSFTAAPEPTSGLLMLVGLAGLALRRKNKRA